MKRRPERADFLLSQGNLSGEQREQVLARVLETVGAEAPARRWRRWWAAAPAAVALAAVALWVGPRLGDGGLRARGVATPILRVDCEPGGLGACQLGGTLLFAVEGAPRSARIAAWAEPVGGGERVWYFSGEGESPAVSDQTPDRILRRGIRLGPEHRPGAYRLTVLLTAAPMPRSALLESSGEGALAVRRETLTVVP